MKNSVDWDSRVMRRALACAGLATTTLLINDAAHSAEGGLVLEEIVVSAQRREENLQQVPVSINAIAADAVQSMALGSTLDLSAAAPAVTVSPQPGGAAFTIRGISGTGSGGDESPNAMYLDGVYLKSVSSLVFALKDIERVEVLKGPQGTLFGRNATGGVIQILTKNPTQEPHVDVSLGYGNYEAMQANGYATMGLTDTLSASLTLYYEDQGEGWGRNVVRNEAVYQGESQGARAKLRWEPSDATEVLLTALYSEVHPTVLGGTRIVPGLRTAAGDINSNLDFYDTNTNSEHESWFYQRNFSATVNHDFDWARFVSITAYDDTTLTMKVDSDSSPAPGPNVSILGPDQTWTQEFQLQSPASSTVQWIAGLYYMSNEQGAEVPVNVGPIPLQFTDATVDNQSYAAFAQTTFPVAAASKLTLGLRYTQDEKVLDDVQTTFVPPPARTTVVNDAKTTDSKLTWRVAFDHQFTEDLLGYVSQSRGFKSGSYNGLSPLDPASKPSTLDASEIGIKSEFGRVRLNAAAYYYKYSDMQVRLVNPSGVGTRYVNAAEATMKGVDLDVETLVTDNFRLWGSLAWLHGKYDKFPGAETYFPNPAPAPASVLVSCSPFPTAPASQAVCQANGVFSSADADASGNWTIQSPEWVGSLTAQYKIATTMGDLVPSVTYVYNDGFYWNPQNRTKTDAYSLVNATLTWTAPEGGWNAQLWGRNLTDEEYFASTGTSGSGDNYWPGAPRTYGMSFGWRF